MKKNCTNFLQQCTKVWDFSEHLFIYKNKIPLFKLPLGLTPSLSFVNIHSRNCAAHFSVSSLYFMPILWMLSLKWILNLKINIASSLAFPGANSQWIGPVNTTASSCVHIADELSHGECPRYSASLYLGQALLGSVSGRKYLCFSKKKMNVQESKKGPIAFYFKSS